MVSLLKVAFCQATDEEMKKNVEEILVRLENMQYRRQEKNELEKLDEENYYAAIHYAVLGNNNILCNKLLFSYNSN